MGEGVVIRPVVPGDERHVLRFIRELAVYERLEHQLDVDESRLREHLFGARPACEALLAELGGKPVGFALFFTTYSTFRTAPCMHLEDLFVMPDARGHGIGLALLRRVAAIAHERGCPRLDWNVLDWNTPAIGFYEAQGAVVLPDWRVCRLEGDALRRCALA
jgi:GNAT superfamily N-acetyltransferase